MAWDLLFSIFDQNKILFLPFVCVFIYTQTFFFIYFNSILVINKVVQFYIYIIYLWYAKWNKGYLQHFIIKNATRILFLFFF